VVVDNASPDGSADRIESHIARLAWGDWARVLRSPVNGGFAAGNNLGIRAVTADAYVLLNSDTLVRPGAIAGLRQALAEHPEAGMIGPSFEGTAGAPEQSCFRFPRPLGEFVRAANSGPITKLLRRYEVPLPFSESPMEPDWIGFACVVIRRAVIDQVGLLDDGYFMYFEDIDYCRRVRAAGWSILYWPKPRIVHFMGRSSNISSEDTSRRRPARYFYESRARYLAKHFGISGLLAANVFWMAGRAVSYSREVLEGKQRKVRDREGSDIWTNVLQPFRRSTAAPAEGTPETPGRLLELLREDFDTHERDLLSPGFWAIAVHRFGNWGLGAESAVTRAPFALLYRGLSTSVDWLWDIRLGVDVKVGRRVRIWRHGSMDLDARAIGDDVQIRQNSTFGDPGRVPTGQKPIIEDRVDIGVGVSILGGVTIGHDTVIGPNAVVLAGCPPHSRLEGVPARAAEKPTQPAIAR
jgi:GT2 family glycosyltransferase/serine acetyltransferase